MYKKYLPLLLSVFLFSCDVKRRDKLADDSPRLSDKEVKEKLAAEQQKINDEALKNVTTVQIIDSSYNFGSVVDGEKVEYNFRFKNTGNKPLVVINVSASCGCTVPQKPEQPIMPGETGFIKAVFNSTGRVGHAEKHITVVSNARPEFPLLELTGEVKAND